MKKADVKRRRPAGVVSVMPGGSELRGRLRRAISNQFDHRSAQVPSDLAKKPLAPKILRRPIQSASFPRGKVRNASRSEDFRPCRGHRAERNVTGAGLQMRGHGRRQQNAHQRSAWWLQAAPADMANETIICAVAVVSGRADPLSRFDYTQQVFARMAAHAKEVILP